MSHSETQKSQVNGHQQANLPEPEVLATANRRQFSPSYKLRIIAEADACSKAGEVGALLRREGLYSSNLSSWRKQQRQGSLKADKGPKRGRKQKDQRDKELTKLRAENEKLKVKLAQAETIIDIQKKLSVAFGLKLDGQPANDKD